MNTKDIKNGIVFMDSHPTKIRNSQYEFTKAIYILERVPPDEKHLRHFLWEFSPE